MSFSICRMYSWPKLHLQDKIWLWIIKLLPAKSRQINIDLAENREQPPPTPPLGELLQCIFIPFGFDLVMLFKDACEMAEIGKADLVTCLGDREIFQKSRRFVHPFRLEIIINAVPENLPEKLFHFSQAHADVPGQLGQLGWYTQIGQDACPDLVYFLYILLNDGKRTARLPGKKPGEQEIDQFLSPDLVEQGRQYGSLVDEADPFQRLFHFPCHHFIEKKGRILPDGNSYRRCSLFRLQEIEQRPAGGDDHEEIYLLVRRDCHLRKKITGPEFHFAALPAGKQGLFGFCPGTVGHPPAIEFHRQYFCRSCSMAP